MPTRHNSDLSYLNALNRGMKYENMHGPFENFGIFNGQFEQGPSGQDETEPPEGWEWTRLGVGGTLERVTGGFAGSWCMKGGNAGTAQGGYLISQKYIPVSCSYYYYLQVVAKQTGNGTLRYGLDCFTASKVANGQAYTAAAFIPAATWTVYWAYIAAAHIPLTAGTQYVRARMNLQMNAALTGAYVYVDDVKFQQVPAWAWTILPNDE